MKRNLSRRNPYLSEREAPNPFVLCTYSLLSSSRPTLILRLPNSSRWNTVKNLDNFIFFLFSFLFFSSFFFSTYYSCSSSIFFPFFPFINFFFFCSLRIVSPPPPPPPRFFLQAYPLHVTLVTMVAIHACDYCHMLEALGWLLPHHPCGDPPWCHVASCQVSPDTLYLKKREILTVLEFDEIR